MTDKPDSLVERQEAVERLRSAYIRIQRIKRGNEPSSAGSMQPLWDAINAIPAALYHLDRTPEFEADLAAEEAEAERTAAIAAAVEAERERAVAQANLRAAIYRRKAQTCQTRTYNGDYHYECMAEACEIIADAIRSNPDAG